MTARRFVFTTALAAGALTAIAAAPSRGDTPCGAAGERACCIGESDRPSAAAPACPYGTNLVEVPGCVENCNCTEGLGKNAVFASSHCEERTNTPCGAAGQRACCLGEHERPFGIFESGCKFPAGATVIEVPGCQAPCFCGEVESSSSSHCDAPIAPNPCGAPGQRACCIGENGRGLFDPACPFKWDANDPPTAELGGCYENCLCSGGGIADSRCVLPTPCGGPNQRGCCASDDRTHTGGAACQPGLTEVNGCNEADCYCGGANRSNLRSNSTCIQATPCGGDGQRACCGGELINLRSCAAGFVEIPGCSGDCTCGGSANPALISSSGTCVPFTPCGARGERGCCFALERPSEGTGACDDGLTEVVGCQGNCTCGGNGIGQNSSSMCADLSAPVSDPTTGWQPPAAPPACPLRGFADLHVHLMAHHAHGGKVLFGTPYHPTGTIAEALAKSGDEAMHSFDHALLNIFGGPRDPIGSGTQDGAQSNYGSPAFSGWPAWTSTAHQQVYYTWLERAYRGGLRLMVMLAVTNEALCRGTTANDVEDALCAHSMPTILTQIEEAKKFQAFIDTKSGGPGRGWFKIVTTPADARREVAAGNLAVVLGIEVDNLFNCKKNDPACDETLVTNNVNFIRNLGVRHVFPIHNFDNAFGGPAIFQDAINVGNRASEGDFYSPEPCPAVTRGYATTTDFSGMYGFRLDPLTIFFINLFGFSDFGVAPTTPAGTASCNSRGLTPLGRHLLTKLMDGKMIIDVDHMSIRSLAETVGMAAARGYPLVASHVIPFDLNAEPYRHERMRTAHDLEQIRDLGGMIAVMTKDDLQDTGDRYVKTNLPYVPPSGPTIADDCRHSSKTFAQAYQYAVETMGVPVAFGTDFNGIAAHIGPRFGSSACGLRHDIGAPAELRAERIAQQRAGNQIQYPFTIPGFGTFDRQVTGQRTFDFNTDGLAHIGLLPDLVADLKQIGLSDDDLEPLFGSAEAYIRMWERIEGVSPPNAPAADCVSPTVVADAQCLGTASIAGPTLPTDGSVVLRQDPPGPYRAGFENSVTLTVTPALSCESSTSCTASVHVVDRTPPPITCPADVTAECAGDVTTVALPEPALGADNCGFSISGGCSHGAFRLGPNEVSCTARDASLNQSSCTFAVHVIDTAAPELTVPPDLTGVECTSPAGASPDLGQATATDRCDPSPLVDSGAPPVLPRGQDTVVWTARDASGNSISVAQRIEVVDTTPPTITCPDDIEAECTGAGKASVTPGAANATDVCGTVDVTTYATADFPLGTTSLTYVASDLVGLEARCTSEVTVVDTTPPAIVCPAPARVECATNHSAPFTPASATASDACGDVAITDPPAGTFPSGTTTLAYSATDAAGLRAHCSSSVTVGDTTPPAITALTVTPTYLWPPDHKMRSVTLTVTASDRCSPATPLCHLTAIRSNEPINGLGDGDTAPDWEITGPLTAMLRSERGGTYTIGAAPDISRPGRIYTLEMTCTDDVGNRAVRTTTVSVPHDQRKKK